MSNMNYAPDGFAGGPSGLKRPDSEFQQTVDRVSALIEAKKGTWNGISPEAVGRMRLQNRFQTGLDIARYTAKIMREDMETMGPVRLREVEQAQMAMVQTAKDLANKGEIVLVGAGGDDDELVY